MVTVKYNIRFIQDLPLLSLDRKILDGVVLDKRNYSFSLSTLLKLRKE